MTHETIYADCLAETRAVGAPKRPRPRGGPKRAQGDDRPRERMAANGAQALRDEDLLAIVLNTGIKGKNVRELAGELLRFLDGPGDPPSPEELSRISGVGMSKACAIAAMIEFGRRRWGPVGTVVGSPLDVFGLVRHHADKRQERFVSVSLNGAREVLAVRVVTVGLVDRAMVHPREIFADLLQDRASAFVVAHNHPSGRLKPSPDDDAITERVEKAARLLGLGFLDHLVFSPTDFYSYRLGGRALDGGKDAYRDDDEGRGLDAGERVSPRRL